MKSWVRHCQHRRSCATYGRDAYLRLNGLKPAVSLGYYVRLMDDGRPHLFHNLSLPSRFYTGTKLRSAWWHSVQYKCKATGSVLIRKLETVSIAEPLQNRQHALNP